MPEALRYNTGKPQLSYVLSSPRALGALARVFEQGAIKYERDNWRLGGKPDEEYIDSAGRHLASLAKGETYDPDTGCFHAAHVMWNMLALIELNYDWPDLNSDFDQQAFVDKYDRTVPRPGVDYDLPAEKTTSLSAGHEEARAWAETYNARRATRNPIDL